MATLLPAAAVGMTCLALVAATIWWWRGRLGDADTESMRARIAAAAPDPAEPPRASAPVLRHLQPRSRSNLAQRNLLASSFVGRDRTALPLE